MDDKLQKRQLSLRFDEPPVEAAAVSVSPPPLAEVIDLADRRAAIVQQTRSDDDSRAQSLLQRAIHSVRFF